MCNNEVWVLLGVVFTITWTNAELLKNDDDIEISNDPLLDNKLRHIVAEFGSPTNYSANKNSTTDTGSNRRKLGKGVTAQRSVAHDNKTLLLERTSVETPYTLPFWSSTKPTTKERNRKSRKKFSQEELRRRRLPNNYLAERKPESNGTRLRARIYADNHDTRNTKAIWVSNEEKKLNVDFEYKPEKDIWPKLAKQSRRYKQVTGGERTTRRHSPLFLMQKPEEPSETPATEKPKETQGKNDDDEKLMFPPLISPYSMKDEMLKIASKFTGINISVEVLGKTIEYNEIVLVKASDLQASKRTRFRTNDDKFIDEAPEKKIILIVHALNVQGLHQLPCLTRPSGLQKLLALYFAHLESFDIFIIPMANPDGFAYVKSNPPWSKNRSPQSACPGVHLDRNFDVGWTNAQGNISSCSELYPGPSPFSEPESRAVRDLFHQYSHKIIAYIHVHAGMDTYEFFKGEAVLYPRGYTDAAIDDDRYVDLRFGLDEMMRNASFQVVTVGMDTLNNWYGPVAGTSVDYASEVYGIPYALEFAMQLYDLHPLEDNAPKYSELALSEIWRRVIDTVFNHISEKTGATCVGDAGAH